MSLGYIYSLPETIGTGAVTVINLTGLSATGQVGTLSVGLQIGVSGVAATGAAGNVTLKIKTGKLSGAAATGVAALLTITDTITLPDVFATGAAGLATVGGAGQVQLSGVDAVGAVGQTSEILDVNPSGVDAASAVGALSIGGGVAGQLSGVNGTGAAGLPSTQRTLPGVFATGITGFPVGLVLIPKVVLLTAGSTWQVPNDWNSANNTIACIGGGGGGGNGLSGAGGGGGGYSSAANVRLTAGSIINIQVGSGGIGGAAATSSNSGASGGDTWLGGTSLATSLVGAHGGQGGGAGGLGGSTTGAVGTTLFAGGAGGGAGTLTGGGGGGAAGPQGAGAQGGSGSYAGAGGGGDGGGSAGANSTNQNPGAGGHNASGTGSGAAGVYQFAPDGLAGTAGGGGGGGYGDAADPTGLGSSFAIGVSFVGKFAGAGGAGGPGTEWGAQGGSGGGGGGGGSTTGTQISIAGGSGGLYGGGGAAGGLSQGNGNGDAGGNGAQGAILILYYNSVYVPLSGPVATGEVSPLTPEVPAQIFGGVSATSALGVIPDLIESLGSRSVSTTAGLGRLVYDEFGIVDGQSSQGYPGQLTTIGSYPALNSVQGLGVASFLSDIIELTLPDVYSTGFASPAQSAALLAGVNGQGVPGNVLVFVPSSTAGGVFGLGGIGSLIANPSVGALGLSGSGFVGNFVPDVSAHFPISIASTGLVGALSASTTAFQFNGVQTSGTIGAIVASEFAPALGVLTSGNAGTAQGSKGTLLVGVLSATAIGVFQDTISSQSIPAGVFATGQFGGLVADPSYTLVGVLASSVTGLGVGDVEAQGFGVVSSGAVGASTAATYANIFGLFATGALGSFTEIIGAQKAVSGVNAAGVLGSLSVSAGDTAGIFGTAISGFVGLTFVNLSDVEPSVYATGLAGLAVVPVPIFGVLATGQLGAVGPQLGFIGSGVQATGGIGSVIVPTSTLAGGVSTTSALGSLTSLFDVAYPGVFAAGEAGSLVLVRAALSGVSGTGASGLLLASSLHIPGVSALGEVGQPRTLIKHGHHIQVPSSPSTFVLPAAQSFANQFLSASLFNTTIRNNGIRLGWMRSHACACTMSGNIPGAPNPTCNTCHGRGRWWEPPSQVFTGLLTFMHTMEASDEPGVTMDSRFGVMAHAEPTITIPSDIQPCWSMCSLFDAFIEQDALTRFETVLTVGGVEVLPYQQNLQILSVTAYDSVNKVIIPLGSSSYSISDGQVSLIGFSAGTSYTVSYNASPVYVVWRRVGGLPHQRPFGAGTAALPTRFRAMPLDLWTRARNTGLFSASPQA